MQYNLVPANGQWHPLKVTVGLASHWTCVTDISGSQAYVLKAWKREMSTRLCSHVEHDWLYLYQPKHHYQHNNSQILTCQISFLLPNQH